MSQRQGEDDVERLEKGLFNILGKNFFLIDNISGVYFSLAQWLKVNQNNCLSES